MSKTCHENFSRTEPLRMPRIIFAFQVFPLHKIIITGHYGTQSEKKAGMGPSQRPLPISESK